MQLVAKDPFKPLIAFVDAINPYIVLISIVGLILEYTPLKPYVLYVNQAVDFLFVLDFAVRMISFPVKRYFVNGYGWVDLLASLPGFMFFIQIGAPLGLFKVLRIGRFFKIIRVLRFLRIFNFLKKMKSDSVFIQERIMKIGISIVMIYVVGIALIDPLSEKFMLGYVAKDYQNRYELFGNDVKKLAANATKEKEIAYYTHEGNLYSAAGVAIPKKLTEYEEKKHESTMIYHEISFTDKSVKKGNVTLPQEGVLIRAASVMRNHNTLMLILVLILIVILVFIIFYVGYIFARDMRVVHLIVDSIDADDYWLFMEEAKQLAGGDQFETAEGEDEIDSLMKMVAKLVKQYEKTTGGSGLGIGLSSFASMGMPGGDALISPDTALADPDNDNDDDDIDLDELEYEDLDAPHEQDPSLYEAGEPLDDEEDDLSLSLDEEYEEEEYEEEEEEGDLEAIEDVTFDEDEDEDFDVTDAPKPVPEEEETVSPSLARDEATTSLPAAVTPEAMESLTTTLDEIRDLLKGKVMMPKDEVERLADESALNAVKVSTKSIVEYIKKYLKK